MQRLVKYICSVLLAVLVMTMTSNQEHTTWQEAMPQKYGTPYISAEQPTSERTIAHLLDEQIAISITAVGENPGYHPQHSKPKCLHTTDKQNRYVSYLILRKGTSHLQSPIYHHVIDYYIYTLEHILI